MPDIIFAAILIVSTAFLIAAIRFAVSFTEGDRPKPKADLRLYYDEDCDCFEYVLDRALRAFSRFDLNLTIVDNIGTNESERWLYELSKKLGAEFIIETEGGCNFKRESDDQGHGRQRDLSE